jgi:hypothetical protein
MSLPPKMPSSEILGKVGACVNGDLFRFTNEALQRLQERSIMVAEVIEALRTASHVEAWDRFKDEHQAWNYGLLGHTIDLRPVRLAVTFDEGLLVITVIPLGGAKK